MARKRLIIEFGIGSSLRRSDYTKAAARAIKDALWHNSISVAELFDFSKDDMIIDVQIGVQKPDAVDATKLKSIFPYGQPNVQITKGGLDIPKPGGTGITVIANAAISVSFDMEPTT